MNQPILICAKNVHLHQAQPEPQREGVKINVNWPGTASKAAQESRELGNGEKITQKQALEELKALGQDWKLPSPHDLFSKVDYGYKNQHGAYSRDETLKADCYWTDQETPWYEGGRVVVGFDGGGVGLNYDSYRAFARAVRVSGQ